jgi:peptide/nickel transport system permease protein
MPGDPVMNLLGEDAGVTQEAIDRATEALGLDKPIYEQYGIFLVNLVHGDLGYSYHYYRPVAGILMSKAAWTLLLTAPPLVAGTIIGSVLGAFAGYYDRRMASRACSVLVTALYAAPPFVLSILLLYLFSFKWGLFPLKGFYATRTVSSVLSHMALPWAALTLCATAHTVVVMRGAVLQEKGSQYILSARARGLCERDILFRHVYRNALLPVLSMVAISFGFLLSGALLVEIVFSLNGMGYLIYDAVMSRDYPVLQGSFLVITVMVLASHVATDLLYAVIDPRIRRHGR